MMRISQKCWIITIEIISKNQVLRSHLGRKVIGQKKQCNKMHQCYLSLGSNLGDSAANLKSAIELLSNNFALDVVAVSETIKTKPYGHITAQNDFYNVCVSIRTWYCPFSLSTFNFIQKQKAVQHLSSYRSLPIY